jgi:hypothetical protein
MVVGMLVAGFILLVGNKLISIRTSPTAAHATNSRSDSLVFELDCSKRTLELPDDVKLTRALFVVPACGPTRWVEIPSPDTYFQMQVRDIRGPKYNTYVVEVMYDEDRAKVNHVEPDVPLAWAGGKAPSKIQTGTVNLPNKFRFTNPSQNEKIQIEVDFF